MWQGIVASFLGFFASEGWKKILKCIPALVAEAEKAMADGKITADERKTWVLRGVEIISTEFGTKIPRWIVSMIVDMIARKLPSKDIKIPDIVVKITKEW